MTRRRRVRERKQRNKMRRIVRWITHGSLSYAVVREVAKQTNQCFDRYIISLQGIVDGLNELINNNPYTTNPAINNPAINNPIMNDRKGCRYEQQQWIHQNRSEDS